MRRLISIILTILITAELLPVTIQAANTAVSHPRVVVDGQVSVCTGYLVGGEYYFSLADTVKIAKLAGKTFNASSAVKTTVNGTTYYQLRGAARKFNISFEHDRVLDAIYIWSDTIYFDEGDEEIARAIQFGLVPAALQKDYGKQIAYKEFCEMLTAMVKKIDSSKAAAWQKVAALAIKSKHTMLRRDGYIAALYAAEAVGIDKYNSFDYQLGIDGSDWWSGFDWSYPVFPNWNKPKSLSLEGWGSDNWENYAEASLFYVIRRLSSYSNMPVFEFNSKTLRPDTALSRRDAIKAVDRLYESVTKENADVAEKMISINKVGTYNKSIITDTLIAKAAKMTQPTAKKIPYYTGFGIHDKSAYWGSKNYWSERDIQMIAEWGFNYVRVLTDALYLFNDDITQADQNQLEDLDRLISWGAKYGVHIDFQITNFPGWRVNNDDAQHPTVDVDIYTNKLKQTMVQNLWKTLAKRYKGVPNSVLDFSINHEPMNWSRSTIGDYKPALYKDVYNFTIGVVNAVRSVDKGRLMFAESGYQTDSEDSLQRAFAPMLKDTGIVLTDKSIKENNFTYWNFQGSDYVTGSGFLPEWPMTQYDIYPVIKDGAPLLFDGLLEKETKFELLLSDIGGNGTLNVSTNGEKIYSTSLSPGAKSVSFTLEQNVKELEVSFEGNWIKWSNVEVTLPEKYAVARRWFTSYADGGKNDVKEIKSSTITIAPKDGKDGPQRVTIDSDCTYKTDGGSVTFDKNTFLKRAKEWADLTKSLGVAGMNNEIDFFQSTGSKDALRYLEDILSALNENSIGWTYYSTSVVFCKSGDLNRYGFTPAPYGEYKIDAELLKMMQKYQSAPSPTDD